MVQLENGTTYIAETCNHIIRRVLRGGESSVFAGTPGVVGSADGPLHDALFFCPTCLVLDSQGRLFVADSGNDSVRVIDLTRAYVGGNSDSDSDDDSDDMDDDVNNEKKRRPVTRDDSRCRVITVAGKSGSPGHVDGQDYRTTRLSCPIGLTRDEEDKLYVADAGNHCIRVIQFVPPPESMLPTRPRVGSESSSSSNSSHPMQPVEELPSSYLGAALVVVTTVLLSDDGEVHIWPTATLMDAMCNVFIVDAPSQRITKIQPDGE